MQTELTRRKTRQDLLILLTLFLVLYALSWLG
jgi:hypothetical protein